MNAKICKYPLEITYSQQIEMPIGAQILKIAIQDNIPYMWVTFWLDREKRFNSREFITIDTGIPFDYSNNMRFIDSYILLEKNIYSAFHVFEVY